MDYYQFAGILLILIAIIIYLNSKEEKTIEGLTDTISDEGLKNIASVYNDQNLYVQNLTINGTFNHVSKGTIVIWNGTTSNIPSGWVICDGKNGTPNLMGRYPIGNAKSGLLQNMSINASGSTNTTGNHTHSVSKSTNRPLYYIALCCKPSAKAKSSASTATTGNHNHTTTINKLNKLQLNQFNALFIMKT